VHSPSLGMTQEKATRSPWRSAVKTLEQVLGREMEYVEARVGDPIALLHRDPTSSSQRAGWVRCGYSK
jgi:hypothetical protein